MSEINKCKREGCAPVFQSRGKMQPEDHHMQYNRYNAMSVFMREHGVWFDLATYGLDVYEVEQDPHSTDDIRISCAKCGKATPWVRRDIEETRRHGDGDYRRYTVERDGNLELMYKRWNDGIK